MEPLPEIPGLINPIPLDPPSPIVPVDQGAVPRCPDSLSNEIVHESPIHLGSWHEVYIDVGLERVRLYYFGSGPVTFVGSRLVSGVLNDHCVYIATRLAFDALADMYYPKRNCIRSGYNRFYAFVGVFPICYDGSGGDDYTPSDPVIIETGGGGGPEYPPGISADPPGEGSTVTNVYTHIFWVYDPGAISPGNQCDGNAPAYLQPHLKLTCLKADDRVVIQHSDRVFPNGSYMYRGNGPFIVHFYRITYLVNGVDPYS